MDKMNLMAQIMMRVGSLGDAELAGMIGELFSEITNNATEGTAPQATTKGQKYVVCVEATVRGEKIYHPIIGGSFVPRNIADFKMTIDEDLVKLQRDTGYMKSSLANMGLKVIYVPVSDEQIASLNEKLAELMKNLEEMVEKAAEAKAQAAGVMNVKLNINDITNEMLSEIIRKTYYSGAGIKENGEVVVSEDEPDEQGMLRNRNAARKESSNDYDEEDAPMSSMNENCYGDCDLCEYYDCCEDAGIYSDEEDGEEESEN